ncbi:MAG TPA: diaminopimelate decarboxylase [Calditrichaeota bacterium]|nr:diaminopimelate decarboxylase [Calditrichota bacterium]
MGKAFHFKKHHFFCDDIDIVNFASQRRTPFYLYSARELKSNLSDVNEIGRPYSFTACYALKANYNPGLLKIIKEYNFGADVVSGGELFFALKAGFTADKIVFAGVGKTEEELELAVKTGITSVNVESESEMKKLDEVALRLKKKVSVAIRINPDIDVDTHEYISTGKRINKFGIEEKKAYQLYKDIKNNPWLLPEGVHVHIGSQIKDKEPFERTAQFLQRFIAKLEKEGIHIKNIDLGGGIGINYENDFSDPLAPSTYIGQILPYYLKAFGKTGYHFTVELGRSIIASAGILISKVLYRKQSADKTFIIIDAAMNNLIRPSLYQAYHHIIPLEQNDRPQEVVDVVGPVCETGDFLAKNRTLPRLEEGEYIAVVGAGAYGQSLASNYNLRPVIAEYLVEGKTIQTIHKEQKIEDLFNQFI